MPKAKCPPAGAPEWVLTYGDLMSLLLCFFILLAALSELKKDLRSVPAEQMALTTGTPAMIVGPDGPGTSMSALPERNNSFIPLLSTLAQQRDMERDQMESQADQMAITAKPPETLYQVGGSILFNPYAFELDAEALAMVKSIADKVRGYSTGIEIRGHAAVLEKQAFIDNQPASTAPTAEKKPDNDLWLLSHQRARAVMNELLKLGIPLERMKITSAGDAEPMIDRRYTHADTRVNRRVEVLLSNHVGTRVVRQQN